MLLMQNPLHLLSRNPKRNTESNGCRRGRSKRASSRHRFLAKEISSGEERHRGFLSPFGNNREFGSATLKVKHGVSRTPLVKKNPPWFDTDASSNPFSCKKDRGIKRFADCSIHLDSLFLNALRVPRKPHYC
jgi:hypothetical protein